MSENPANRERTRHVDTRVHYLRELVRDGHVKLLKCAGPQNVADALTKSLPRPALAKHRQYMWGTRIPFSAFLISLTRLDDPRPRLIISSHHADIESHAPPEKYFRSGRSCVCLCVCVDMTYDATIDTGEERNKVWFTRVWGHKYVITSLLEIAV